VVEDHVQAHGQPAGVGGVDEGDQGVGPPVGAVDREEVDPVVAPPELPGELGQGHELDRADAEVHELVEPLDRAGQGPAPGERGDVDLVDDAAQHLLVGGGDPVVVACRPRA